MISFIAVLVILFLYSLLCRDEPAFSRDKMMPLKAVLAILIVADHLTFHISADWIQPMRKWGTPIVSMFLFVSGYGLLKSYLSKGQRYLTDFLKTRVLKVLIPALVAYLFYCLICWRHHDWLSEFSRLFMNGVPLLPYSWFVEVIVLLYLGFWIVYSFVPEKYKLASIIIWSLAMTVGAVVIGYDRCWWVTTIAFPSGLIYAEYEERISKFSFRSTLSYVVAFGSCLALTALFYVIGNQYLYPVCYIFIPIAVALVVSKMPLQKLNDFGVITFLGTVSYEIYLCQGIGMEFLRGGLIDVKNDVLYLALVYVSVICLAFVTHRISAWFAGKWS